MYFKLNSFAACVLFGFDHFGGDINAETANDYEHCQRKCSAKKYCKRWTFVISKNQECHLKTNISEKVLHCHDCKTGFRDSSNIKCGENGRK